MKNTDVPIGIVINSRKKLIHILSSKIQFLKY